MFDNSGFLLHPGTGPNPVIVKDSLHRFTWFLLFLSVLAYSQSRVGEWNSYTSFLTVRQAIEVGQDIVFATSGGILIFDRASESFETLTNIHGLRETDLSAIDIDKNGYLWVGSSSPTGVVQIFDLANRRAVKTFDFDLSSITAITTADSVVFVAYSKNLEWGILEFAWHENEYIYRQIYKPSEESMEYIADLAMRGDSLFAATDLGLFVGDYRRFILNYPQNWELLSGFSVSPVTRLDSGTGEFLIIADGEIWSYSDEPVQLSDAYKGKSSLLDVARGGDGKLYGLLKGSLVRFDDQGGIDTSWNTLARSSRLQTLNDGNLLVLRNRGFGIWVIDKQGFEWHAPNTPVSNVYTSLAVLEDGRLVAAGKEGVSVLSEHGWYNLVPSPTMWAIRDHSPEQYSEFVADTAQFKSSRVWSLLARNDEITMSLQGVYPDTNEVGHSIGGGVVRIDLSQPSELIIFDTTEGHINPYDESGYMNVRGLHFDDDENLWISNFGAGDLDRKVTVMTSEGVWSYVPQLGSGGIAQKLESPTDVLVIKDNVIMVGSSKDDGLFILKLDQDSDGDGVPDVLDEDANESDILPVTWVNFSANDGLSNNTVWSLISPEPSAAWALTAQGLQRLTFNSDYTKMTPYFFTYFSGVPFGEGSKVHMDGRENVWVSSVTAGVYILLANATPWPDWNGFQHNNSYLLSDEVTAVAFDNEKGVAYIATSKGINSLRIPFAEKRKTYDKVIVFPSPYRIPSSQPMVIDGLMDHSSLKIMMLSGRVLREIKAISLSVHGYQAFWDGRTDGGEYVGTGVYLVAIYSETGESHVAKIAVIRE